MISISNKNILVYILVLTSFRALPQSAKIDSLLQVVGNTGDTLRVKALHDLAFEYWNFDVEKAYSYAIECNRLADELDYKPGLAWSNTNIGLYHFHKGNYDTALIFYRSAIKSLGERTHQDYPAYPLSRIANLYRVQSQFDSALFYYRLAMSKFPPNTPDIDKHTIYYNMGIAYLEMEQYDSAKTNIAHSLKVRQEIGDVTFIASSLNEMGRVFIGLADFDSANHYLTRAKFIGDRYNLPEVLIYYLIYSSELQLTKGNYAQAIENIKSSLSLLNDYDFQQLKVYGLYLLGTIYSEIGEYDGAIDNLLKSLTLNKPLNNTKLDAQINFVLGYIYYYQKNIKKAKEVANLSKQLFQEIGLKRREAATNNLLGLIELYAKDYEASANYFDTGMKAYEELDDKKGIASILYNKSYIYLEQGETQKVMDMQLKALALEQEINNIPGIIISYNWLGDLLTANGEYDLAEEYLIKAKDLLAAYPTLSNEEENNRFFSQLYAAKKDYKKAYEYLKLNKQNADSIFSLNSLNKSLQLSAIHDLEKKEIDIQNLNRDRETKNFELALQRGQLEQQRLLIYLGGIAIIFFAFLSYFLVRTIKKLRATQQDLIKAEKRASLGILVAGLSHEINNPLNFIKGGVETLRLNRAKWTKSELLSLHAIDEGVSRTNEIVKVLNQFQKQKSSEYQPCDLNKIINESLKEMKDDFSEGIRVAVTEYDKDAVIDGNLNDLKQLFKELLKNSIQSIDEEGEITIGIHANNAQCTVQIKDNGFGIDEDNLTRLENPFFTTKAPNRGKGLGLYLVDYILYDHKGKISFDSVKGKGTVALVSLPKRKQTINFT